MAIEDVLTRISAIQARFGVGGSTVGSSEFEGVLSDAARHAGVSPNDRVDGTATAAGVSIAGGADTDDTAEDGAAPETSTATAAGSTTSAPVSDGSATVGSTTSAPTTSTGGTGAEATTEPVPSDIVSILDDLGGSTDVRSGEALEALSAASASALTTAAALGGTGSSSLLGALSGQLEAEEGPAMLASIIAQQQAGAGIIRATGS